MGLFNNRKRNEAKKADDGLELRGPGYLRPYLTTVLPQLTELVRIKNPDIQWAGQLVSVSGSRYFSIHYQGALTNGQTVVSLESGVQKIIARDPSSGEDIRLFDNSCHGWSAMMNEENITEQQGQESSFKDYQAGDKISQFQVVVIAYYNSGTRQMLIDETDSEGVVELPDGRRLPLQQVFDNAFDALVVYLFDQQDNRYELINEELG